MARFAPALSVKSLDLREGLAGLTPPNLTYSVRRTALTALSIGALVAGVAAASAAIRGIADSGVGEFTLDGRLVSVSTTGYGWSAGLRTGQLVELLVAADEPGGWRLETTDGEHDFVADGAGADRVLRDALPLGVVALVAAWLAVIFLRTRRRWVLPAATASLLAASIPLRLEGGAQLSTLVMAASALVPAGFYAFKVRGGRRVHLGLGAVLLVLVAIWAVARLLATDLHATTETVRANVALWGTLALVFERGALPAMTGQPIRLMRPRSFDVVVVAGTALVILFAAAVLRADPLATAILLIASLAVVSATRRQLGRPLEDVLFADVRQQAAAEAAEAERAKLARELHDVPLQELAAVIRRLEILPGAEAESEDLRSLAGHLRNVATELRPPVLDDLGLPAALDFLAEEATTSAMPVKAEVIDDTGFGIDRRPPTDIELAMYRIASEAVGNAVRHSRGSQVEIAARVAPDLVEVVVRDDGAGLASDAAREAAKRKRLGLASMRRRAEAIDAELSIEGSSGGTTVRAVWRA